MKIKNEYEGWRKYVDDMKLKGNFVKEIAALKYLT
jgi:hypothetical protein